MTEIFVLVSQMLLSVLFVRFCGSMLFVVLIVLDLARAHMLKEPELSILPGILQQPCCKQSISTGQLWLGW